MIIDVGMDVGEILKVFFVSSNRQMEQVLVLEEKQWVQK